MVASRGPPIKDPKVSYLTGSLLGLESIEKLDSICIKNKKIFLNDSNGKAMAQFHTEIQDEYGNSLLTK